jgi:chemosensory pili system protein ChpA (sensor histidine kinase/response regulator)
MSQNTSLQDVVAAELTDLGEVLRPAAAILAATGVDADRLSEAVGLYSEHIGRLDTAADMLELPAIGQLGRWAEENVRLLSLLEETERVERAASGVVEAWLPAAVAYIKEPGDERRIHGLLEQIQCVAWPASMGDEAAWEVLAALGALDLEASEEAGQGRSTEVDSADLTLTLAEDASPELFEAFLNELPDHITLLTQSLQQALDGSGCIAELERAQRVAHTLKGSASVVGIRGIASFTHQMEDILEFLAATELSPNADLRALLVDASDCLECMADALFAGGAVPEESSQVLGRLLEWAARIDRGELEAFVETESPEQACEDATVGEITEPPVPIVEQIPPQAIESTAAPVTPAATLRVPTAVVDEMMRLVGELSIALGQTQRKLMEANARHAALNQQNILVQQRVGDLQTVVEVRGVPAVRKLAAGAEMDAGLFDPLELDQYHELHGVTSGFVESVTDSRELSKALGDDLSDLQDLLRLQERLGSDFGDTVLHARMVVVETVVPRLQRIVRQTSRTTGKEVSLDVMGAELLVDTDILNGLVDPLLHILRNAVDHGIEDAELRRARGKAAGGQITLEFTREGSNIQVCCRDDGAGFDTESIRFKAEQRGLLPAGSPLSDEEVVRLVLLPGFSTRAEATQVSGRGIGMDVVRQAVEDLQGTLTLSGAAGEGAEITLRLPLTLVSLHVLLVRTGKHVRAVPSNNIEQLLYSDAGQICRLAEGWVFQFGERAYPVEHLSTLLNEPVDRSEWHAADARPLMLVRGDLGITALLIDEALESLDVVVKDLGAYLPRVPGVSGACVLADGGIAPVLDVRQLLRVHVGNEDRFQIAPSSGVGERLTATPRVLVVDDSVSTRRTLAQLVGDAGYQVESAADGLEAIECIERRIPDLVFADLEMPRMNGLELTRHLRSQPQTRELPVVMVTSRSTEKHRQQAASAGVTDYLTKPFAEEAVLGHLVGLAVLRH